MREKYQVKYVSSKADKRLYNIFVDALKLDKDVVEVAVADKMLIKDVIQLIDRLDVVTCKKYLKRLGVTGYYSLNKADTVELLRHELKDNDDMTLKLYEENRVILDMFAYEVIDVLNITKYRFNKIKGSLKVSGTKIVNIGTAPKTVSKYDRRSIYNEMIKAVTK